MLPRFGDIPGWYLLLSIIVSMYQGWCGYAMQSERIAQAEMHAAGSSKPSCREVALYCAADAWFYFLCASFGMASAFMSYWLVSATVACPDGQGRDISAFVLAFVGLVGATGNLPYLIQLGKIGLRA